MSEVNWSNSNISQKVMLTERAVRGTGAYKACEAGVDFVSGKANDAGRAINNVGQAVNDYFFPSEPKQSNDGKVKQDTVRARLLNNPDMLPGGPQSNASFTQDSFAFSPEALALMGC